MEEQTKNSSEIDVQGIVQQAVQEYMRQDSTRREPAYKTELQEEKRRREQLERRVNELVEENRRSRQAAEEAERSSTIRAELQRLGVSKVDLAYRAVQNDIYRTEDGRLLARTNEGDTGASEYLRQFVTENPEFLPARIAGGSGATNAQRPPSPPSSVDLDKIGPGMSKEDLERARQEILRVATQTLRSA
jgi:ATP/maltotriose-dependent transcriptional regulator MalT